MFHSARARFGVRNGQEVRRAAKTAGPWWQNLPGPGARLGAGALLIGLAACAGLKPPPADAPEATVRSYCRSQANVAAMGAPGATAAPSPRTPNAGTQLQVEAALRDCMARYGLQP